MPLLASQPGSAAWLAALCRASSAERGVTAHAEQAHRPGRGQLDLRPGVARGGDRVHHLQRLGRATCVGEQHRPPCLEGADLLGVGQEGTCVVQRGERAVEVAARREARPRQPAAEGDPLRIGEITSQRVGDDALDVLVLAEHVVGLGEHLGAGERVRGVAVRPGGDQLHRQVRVVPRECQPRRLEELLAGDPTAGSDAPQGDLHDVLAAAGAVGLDDVGELLLDPPQPQRRHPCPEHLAVQRVGQAQRRALARHDDRHEPPRLQAFQCRQAVALLEVGQPEALTDGEQLEHRQAGVVDVGEVLVDEVVERHRRRQVADQLPRAPVVDERAAFRGAAHQLGEHLQVAAGQAGELVERGGGHRVVQGAVQQCAELVGAERREVDAGEVPVAFEAGETRRRAAPGADGADHERGARHDQRYEHGQRGVVEQVEIVDEQYEPVVAGQAAQLGASPVEQSRPLVLADAEPADQRGRQQVGERPERDRRRRRVADGARRRPAAALRPGQRLLGEARLADAGRSVEHDTAHRAVEVVASDRLQLVGAARQWPRREGHRHVPSTT